MSVRRVEIWRAGAWSPLSGGEAGLVMLAPGEVFRLFDEAGAPVVGEDGSTRWRVVGVTRDPVTGRVAVEREAIPETSVEAACTAEGFWFPGDVTRSGDLGPPRRLR